MKHRIFALVISAAMILSFSGISAPGTMAATLKGSGTELDPYQIETAEQFDMIREDLTAYYVLLDDIDLSAYENWIPIGNLSYEDIDMESGEPDMSKVFSGTLEGTGHVISGLHCETDDNMIATGLFGCSSGNFTDIVLQDIYVNGGLSTMTSGGLIGYAMDGFINNVVLIGDNTIEGTNCIGGVAGGSMADILYCTVDNAHIIVNGDNDFSDGRLIQCDIAECAGLIAGGSFTGSINDCIAAGTVSATGNEAVGLGGIAGCIQSIESIYGNTADVVIEAGNGHAIGGLCGYAGTGDDGDGIIDPPCEITDCNITLQLTSDGATHVGGLVGTGLYYYGMEDCFIIEDCFVSGTIDGAVSPGTVAGRAEGSTILSCETDILIDGKASDVQVGTTDCMFESSDQYEDAE